MMMLTIHWLKNKSTYLPPKHRNPALERYITKLENTPLEQNNKQLKEKINVKKMQKKSSIGHRYRHKGG